MKEQELPIERARSEVSERSINAPSRVLLRGVGHLLMLLGLVGILVPVLPTTVFWIGAALCYAKSSPRLYRQLTEHPRYGLGIRNFLDQGVISKRGKCAATMGMLFSAVILLFAPLTLVMKSLGLFLIALGALYVLTRPSQVSSSDR